MAFRRARWVIQNRFHFVDQETVFSDMLDVSLGVVGIVPNESMKPHTPSLMQIDYSNALQ
jgi:hypothetical protein